MGTFSGESGFWCCVLAPDGVTVVAGDAGGRVQDLGEEAEIVRNPVSGVVGGG